MYPLLGASRRQSRVVLLVGSFSKHLYCLDVSPRDKKITLNSLLAGTCIMLAVMVHLINSRGAGVSVQLLYVLLDGKRMKLGGRANIKGLVGGTR